MENKTMHIDIVDDEQGDWVALYIDGKLLDENHSLDFHHILQHLEESGIITLDEHVIDMYTHDISPLGSSGYDNFEDIPDEIFLGV